MFSETITAEGHLIDSQILERIFDRIGEHGASYEVLAFDIGRTKDDHSFAKLRLAARDEVALRSLLEALVPYGCRRESERDARFDIAPKDQCVPEDFYSTTNHRTQIRVHGAWSDVGKQRMDAVIVMEDGAPVCRKLRDVRRVSAAVNAAPGMELRMAVIEQD